MECVLIEQHYDLVQQCVSRRLKRMPGAEHLRDDLFGAGQLALVKAAKRLAEKPADNPAAYITNAINRALTDLIAEDDNRAYSARDQRRARQAGITLPKPVIESLEIEVPDPGGDASDLRDFIDSCAKDECDLTIIRLREESRTDAEIAEIISSTTMQRIGASAVHSRRKRIEKTFDERWAELTKDDEGEESETPNRKAA